MPHHGAANNNEAPKNLKSSKEATPETGVQKVTSESLRKYLHEIQQLSYNALDKTEGKGYGERADEVKYLATELFATGTHFEGYVYLDKNGKVAAFMEVERMIGTDKIKVTQLRLTHPSGQSSFINNMVWQVHQDFHSKGYHHLVVDDDNVRKDVTKAEARLKSRLPGYVRSEGGSEKVANDNFTPFEDSDEGDDEPQVEPEKLAA